MSCSQWYQNWKTGVSTQKQNNTSEWFSCEFLYIKQGGQEECVILLMVHFTGSFLDILYICEWNNARKGMCQIPWISLLTNDEVVGSVGYFALFYETLVGRGCNSRTKTHFENQDLFCWSSRNICKCLGFCQQSSCYPCIKKTGQEKFGRLWYESQYPTETWHS